MKTQLLLFLSVLYAYACQSQITYKGHAGLTMFPNHLEICVTVDSTTILYEVFNHWYVGSFVSISQMSIPLNKLDSFNQANDSISIKFLGKKVKLRDKRFRIKKKLKPMKKGYTALKMRMISYACEVTKPYDFIRHYEVYEHKDFELKEEEFKAKVDKNLKELLEVKGATP